MQLLQHHSAPPRTYSIEVHVGIIEQLFSAIDPSPFSIRDLDPDAHEYIVDCCKDLPRDMPLQLVVHLDRIPDDPRQVEQLDHAIQTYFAAQANSRRQELKDLFGRGRISLLIGLAFLSLSIATGELIEQWIAPTNLARIVREGLLIGGWVAMWRPMEIFLYDWWPIRARIRLYERLAHTPVIVLMRDGASRPGMDGTNTDAMD